MQSSKFELVCDRNTRHGYSITSSARASSVGGTAMRGRDEETDFEIKSRNRRRKNMRGPGKFLDKESPIQGPLVPIPKRSTSP